MPISLKNMRGWGCASPASKAICTSATVHRPAPGARINATHHYVRLSKTLSQASELEEKLDGRRDLMRLSPVSCRGFVPGQTLVKPAPSSQQVVVLRVSLHCRGCEAKLRKHLSKMQGVTSFSIDMETKKVTVIGYVTPSDVLTSILKVKKALFWLSPSTSASSFSSSSSSGLSSLE